MYVTAIIAAGGHGQRLGSAQPKQLLTVGGRAILERSIAAFLTHPSIDAVVVTLPESLVAAPPPYLAAAGPSTINLANKPLRIVAGGARRQDSVANGFRAASTDSDVIVIHDAARPFPTADLISRTIAAAVETGAALAAVQARDTVKRTRDLHAPTVVETLPRETIYLAQTPQAFRRDVLVSALAVAEGVEATDEAALAERAGHTVRLIDGEATNIKITTAEDLPIAEAIAAARDRSAASDRLATRGRQSASDRVGTGYDLHRLVDGRALVLGGVTVPSPVGALGHSDADVICHAATDAILGAACIGDIGRHFPDTDPQWKDASSIDLLRRAVAIVAAQGFTVGNLDVTVVLERPKIKDYVDAMRASVAAAIGIDVARVSIKGKTNEGVDAVGRGEAIAAHAIAIVTFL